MANATGARHGMEYVKEVTYGVTPASPALTPVRHNTTSLGLSKESFQSQELRSDRQITDFRHGNRQVGGDIVSELSYGTFDDLLEAALGGTWAADVLKAGLDLSSFTIRRHFDDISQQQVFTGVKFSGLSLAVNGQMSILTLNTLGKNMSTTDITTPTFNSATTTSPFSGLDVGSINEGGSPIGAITEISLSLENGLEAAFALGDDSTSEPTSGRSNITGSVTAFFQSQALLDKFINETETSIDFTVTDPAGNSLKVDLPRVKYSGGQPDVGGEGAILLTMPFQALLDDVEDSNIVITRTPV